MKRIVGVVLLACAFSISLKAQITDDVTESHSNVTWKQKHFFHTIGGSLVLDYFVPPAVRYENIMDNGNGFDTVISYDRNWGFNLASVTYDVRLNLYDISDRMSVSCNVPFSFGFGPVEPGGLLSFASPLLVEFNYGNHSTYNNIDRLGWHVGIGYDVMVTPLIRTSRYSEINRFWGSPMMRAGLKLPYRKHNSFIAAQYSLPRKYYDPQEQSEFKDRYHFKVVVGWLLGYD